MRLPDLRAQSAHRFARIARRTSALALIGGVAIGCKASASAKLEAGGEARADSAGRMDPDAQAARLAGPAEPSGPYEPELLGARHDLRLAAAAGAAQCSCLKVALGVPTDPAFAWRSVVPQIDPTTQLVVALSSEGVACSGAPADSLGASYWGYQHSGDDVIVVVESARSGRPLTSGAIIPKPFGSGQVYIQPLERSVPYGRPLSAGAARCGIGNPGPRRAPASALPVEPQETLESLD